MTLLEVNPNNALNVKFEQSIPDYHVWSWQDAYQQLLSDGANSRLATADWIKNHYKWIIWKLASMIKCFPDLLQEYWTPQTVLNQLKYR